MSVFNLKKQNTDLDKKIAAGLERLSQVFRILLWEKAKAHGLSPIQIQLLIFIQHHSADKATVSYLAREFNFTKPTISDALKILEEKRLLKKVAHETDTRSHTIELTASGRKVVSETEDFANPITSLIAKSSERDKIKIWQLISTLIIQLNKMEIISVRRTCFACKHFSQENKTPFCNLLEQKLLPQDIRIDCAEFEAAA